MSDEVPAAPPPPPSEPRWAKALISVFALGVYLVALVIAYLGRAADPATLSLMIGSAISLGGLVVNYWLGSSSGSDKKTDIIKK